MKTEEFIDVIDETGQKIAVASKTEIYTNKLSHAIVHVLIYNGINQMACQVRSQKKDYCPGYISTSVGGHISSGETPEFAGKREMEEEIGKQGELEHLFSDWYEGKEKIKKILHVYKCDVSGPFKINEDEVEKIVWLDHEELSKLPDTKIHPELKFIIDYLKNEKS